MTGEQMEMIPDSPEDRMVALLVSSGTWDHDSAVARAPKLVSILRSPCRCGGRGGRPCKLRLADPRHGKRNGYVHQGCSCDDCTYANARYIARNRLDAA